MYMSLFVASFLQSVAVALKCWHCGESYSWHFWASGHRKAVSLYAVMKLTIQSTKITPLH